MQRFGRRALAPLLAPVAAAVVLLAAPAAAQPSLAPTSRVLEVEVAAPSLAGNLLDTPTTQGVVIYLPPSYDLEPGRRYPVVYLLHGIFDDYGVWTGHFGVPAILDRLIAASELPELVMVMPNGGNAFGGGFYRNSPVSGNWGDYVTDDLVRYVDANGRAAGTVTPHRWPEGGIVRSFALLPSSNPEDRECASAVG